MRTFRRPAGIAQHGRYARRSRWPGSSRGSPVGGREEPDVSAGVVFLRRYGLLLLWSLLTFAMWRAWQSDRYDPGPNARVGYGHNGPNDLYWGLVLSLIELALVYLALRPWASHRSWGRPLGALAALMLLLPWTALLIAAGLHAGPIFHLNTLWLVILDLITLGTLLGSLASRYIRWRTERERAA